ncbi:hypothetical protein FA95DRAFT_1279442 [Auriscalpium vulgare]|uniref:Uncharacterized protein n=1 Tax=Auriscalpium vulgare TaxID=40419 RepID=A0ACB8RTH2_9AGAM|nr:hypothetical protein FA95DRAFT_1279442 [Auriscalpium vulgare]
MCSWRHELPLRSRCSNVSAHAAELRTSAPTHSPHAANRTWYILIVLALEELSRQSQGHESVAGIVASMPVEIVSPSEIVGDSMMLATRQGKSRKGMGASRRRVDAPEALVYRKASGWPWFGLVWQGRSGQRGAGSGDSWVWVSYAALPSMRRTTDSGEVWRLTRL